MEYIKTVIILFFYFPGQLSYAQFPCGTQVSRQQLEQLDELDKSILKVPIIEDSFSVPVKLHIIRKTDGTGGLSLQKLQKELDSVNYFYKNAKIRFEQCGEINYINNSAYRTLEMPEEEDGLVRSTESPRAINIYFADTVTLDGTRVCGYSFLPMGPNTVFIDNSCVNSGNTLAHELGHFFSLLHTHGQSNTELTDELVNGSNCALAGDFICDTPADPNLAGKVSYNTLTKKCSYTGTAKDANGESFKPMVENIMSYSRPQCTDSLTPEQFHRIRNSLFYHGRVDLICNPGNNAIFESGIRAVIPNPFVNWFFIFYQLSADSRVTLSLNDVTGKRIAVLHDQTEREGLLKLYYPWGNTFLNTGIYFLKMEVNGQLASVRKLIHFNHQ